MADKAPEACCANCDAWMRNGAHQAQGQCRRNPPVPLLTGFNQLAQQPLIQMFWPETKDTDVCRDGHRFRQAEIKAIVQKLDFSGMALEGSA